MIPSSAGSKICSSIYLCCRDCLPALAKQRATGPGCGWLGGFSALFFWLQQRETPSTRYLKSARRRGTDRERRMYVEIKILQRDSVICKISPATKMSAYTLLYSVRDERRARDSRLSLAQHLLLYKIGAYKSRCTQRHWQGRAILGSDPTEFRRQPNLCCVCGPHLWENFLPSCRGRRTVSQLLFFFCTTKTPRTAQARTLGLEWCAPSLSRLARFHVRAATSAASFCSLAHKRRADQAEPIHT